PHDHASLQSPLAQLLHPLKPMPSMVVGRQLFLCPSTIDYRLSPPLQGSSQTPHNPYCLPTASHLPAKESYSRLQPSAPHHSPLPDISSLPACKESSPKTRYTFLFEVLPKHLPIFLELHRETHICDPPTPSRGIPHCAALETKNGKRDVPILQISSYK